MVSSLFIKEYSGFKDTTFQRLCMVFPESFPCQCKPDVRLDKTSSDTFGFAQKR